MPNNTFYRRIGLAGVSPQENPLARKWYAKLQWVMMAVTIGTAVEFVLRELGTFPMLSVSARSLDAMILSAFVLETGILLLLVDQRGRYLRTNWLNLVLIGTLTIGLMLQLDDWLVLLRLVRLTVIGLLITRIAREIGNITPDSAPFLLMLFVGLMLMAAAVFVWIEPTTKTFSQGLWLAFASAATVGYGDVYPTTGAAKFFSAILVVMGYSILTMATASLAAFFIGKEERRLRLELHKDVRQLDQRLTKIEEALARIENAMKDQR